MPEVFRSFIASRCKFIGIRSSSEKAFEEKRLGSAWARLPGCTRFLRGMGKSGMEERTLTYLWEERDGVAALAWRLLEQTGSCLVHHKDSPSSLPGVPQDEGTTQEGGGKKSANRESRYFSIKNRGSGPVRKTSSTDATARHSGRVYHQRGGSKREWSAHVNATGRCRKPSPYSVARGLAQLQVVVTQTWCWCTRMTDPLFFS